MSDIFTQKINREKASKVKKEKKEMSGPKNGFLLLPLFNAERISIAPCFPPVTVCALGHYRILVFPRSIRKFLGWHTCMIPQRQCWLTVLLISGSFVAMEAFAHFFASRPATLGRLAADGLLALACIVFALATAMTDPGLLPPQTQEVLMRETARVSETVEKTATGTSTTRIVEMEEVSRKPSPLHVHGFLGYDAMQELESSRKDRSSYDMPLNDYLCEQDQQYAEMDSSQLTPCKWCQHLRPNDTKHCPRTGTCCRKEDHFCGFLFSQIGLRNLRYFCCFIALCLACVTHGAIVINRPLFNMMVLRDEKLMDGAEIRSVLALALSGAALMVWAAMMLYMVLNYAVMLFVPGAANTRDMWRKICGVKSQAAQYNYAPHMRPSEKEEQEQNKVRFPGIYCGIPPSLLPAWCRDVILLEFNEMEPAEDTPPTAVAHADHVADLQLDEIASSSSDDNAKLLKHS